MHAHTGAKHKRAHDPGPTYRNCGKTWQLPVFVVSGFPYTTVPTFKKLRSLLNIFGPAVLSGSGWRRAAVWIVWSRCAGILGHTLSLLLLVHTHTHTLGFL